jgi:hypothetical protein
VKKGRRKGEKERAIKIEAKSCKKGLSKGFTTVS